MFRKPSGSVFSGYVLNTIFTDLFLSFGCEAYLKMKQIASVKDIAPEVLWAVMWVQSAGSVNAVTGSRETRRVLSIYSSFC